MPVCKNLHVVTLAAPPSPFYTTYVRVTMDGRQRVGKSRFELSSTTILPLHGVIKAK
jgi:hypothetical protein